MIEMEGNMDADPSYVGLEWILGLSAQLQGGVVRCGPQRRDIHVSGQNLVNHAMDVIMINAGKDIGEIIRSYFQNRENFPSQLKEQSCVGVIVSAKGTVSSPALELQGSAVSFNGLHEMTGLTGFYSIPKFGLVQPPDSLKACFSRPDDVVFGGCVSGPLIAARPLQVALMIVAHDA